MIKQNDISNVAQSAGFEPARGDPNRFQVCRLNHSATIADDKEVNQVDRIQVPWVHREGESPDIEAGRDGPLQCTAACTAMSSAIPFGTLAGIVMYYAVGYVADAMQFQQQGLLIAAQVHAHT